MNSNFSNNLKATRLAQGFSQQQMADEFPVLPMPDMRLIDVHPVLSFYRRSPPCFGCLLIICSGTDRLTLPI